jgi:hypothetical protein
LIVAITSLLFLCFVVPASTLQVEKIIYSNLAKLVEGRIERTHEIDFEATTIFAQEAHVIPPDKDTPPGQQRVELIGPEIISVERDPDDKMMMVPKEFYTASRAYVYIDPEPDGQVVNVTVDLRGGFKFPRRYVGATVAGVSETQYGPTQIPSPIKEDVKFMNVWKLKELYADLTKSRKLHAIVAEFVKNAQKNSILLDIANDLNGNRETRFNFGTDGNSRLALESGMAGMMGGEVTLPYRTAAAARAAATQAVATTQLVDRPVIYREQIEGRTTIVRAAYAIVRVRPLTDVKMADMTVELRDCLQMRSETDDMPQPRASYKHSFTIAMSEAARAMAGRGIAYYESPAGRSLGDQTRLTHDRTQLVNMIIAESNSRASFAVSCLILVMLGSALGMMFRSGNFLTAFAVSFIPALLSITLIVAGQRMAGNVPFVVPNTHHPNNSLQMGLALIWSGNAINMVLAVGFLWKLGRR